MHDVINQITEPVFHCRRVCDWTFRMRRRRLPTTDGGILLVHVVGPATRTSWRGDANANMVYRVVLGVNMGGWAL